MNNIAITIFGGTGDLTYRKLMPALYTLFKRHLLQDNIQICATGRRPYQNDDYRQIIYNWIQNYARLKVNKQELQNFLLHVIYFKMDFTNLNEYQQLNFFFKNKIFDQHVIYFAVAPNYFEIISKGLSQANYIKQPKIILEKPFGTDLNNARELSQKLENQFGKKQIYRIDHYLGKEMVRNILTVRNTNPLFAHAWNKDFIESIHISAFETVGVETRGSYYDQTGALKDMVQNHLLQILSIVAIDNPQNNIADEQYKIFKALKPFTLAEIKKHMVLGQYEGYTKEEKVNPLSQTETYAGLKLYVDHPRWKNVAFYIETGKRCQKRAITVTIKFHQINKNIPANILQIQIQPTESINLSFNIKTPGQDSISSVNMNFCQDCNLQFKLNTPEAYERMILSCLNNDDTWFAKWDQIEICWQYIQKLKQLYTAANLPIYIYKQGENHPHEFTNLLNN